MHCRSLSHDLKKFNLRTTEGIQRRRGEADYEDIHRADTPLGLAGYELINDEEEVEVQGLLNHLETLWHLYVYTLEHIT
jgi:hypothetical protein